MFKKIIIPAAVLFFTAANLFALDDGFGEAKKIEGKNVIIYYAAELDIPSLIRQLNISSSQDVLAGKAMRKSFSYSGAELADMIDTLYAQVCDILDMHLYSLQINIKICPGDRDLSGLYNNLFGKDLGGRYSFYVYDNNTVYVSAEHFKQEIMGHEIAHGIINHYFVVPPPVKVQEVLAMYVEYQLRKK